MILVNACLMSWLAASAPSVDCQIVKPRYAADDLRILPFLCAGHASPFDDTPTLRQASGGKLFIIPTRVASPPNAGAAREIDDATVSSNGNLFVANGVNAAVISPDGHAIWSYFAPPNTEIDSIQTVANDCVLIMQSGNPAKALFFNTRTNKLLKQIVIPTALKNKHAMFRNIRMTRLHTLLVPHFGENKVCEYDLLGTRWFGLLMRLLRGTPSALRTGIP